MGRKPNRRSTAPLAAFLWDKCYSHPVRTQAAVAGEIGISGQTFSNLLKGGAPAKHIYDKLKRRYGDEMPAVTTANEIWREQGRRLARQRNPLLAEEARKRYCQCGCGALLAGPDQRMYASRACRGRVARGQRSTAPLAAFLWDKVCSHPARTQAAVADEIGISEQTFRNLLKGGAPASHIYEKLKRRYGDEMPAVTTANEIWREHGRRLARQFGQGLLAEEARKRGSESRRGKKYPGSSPAWSAELSRRIKAGEFRPPSDFRQKPRSRAMLSFAHRIRWNPAPDYETQRRWAAEVGKRLDLPPEAVMAWWRPKLRARGLTVMGRPRNSQRCGLIRRLLPEWASETGRLRRGAWPAIALAVERAEGTAISTETLRLWWANHRRTCGCPPRDHHRRLWPLSTVEAGEERANQWSRAGVGGSPQGHSRA